MVSSQLNVASAPARPVIGSVAYGHGVPTLNSDAFLDLAGSTKTLVEYRRRQVIYSQGGTASTIYCIQTGGVKLSVVNETGKEAVVSLLGPGDFFGEGCLAGMPFRMQRATAITLCTVFVIERKEMIRLLHERHEFADQFIGCLLAKKAQSEEDLVDQLLNPIEKRLARVLLSFAVLDTENQSLKLLPKVSKETLAEMVGTTRQRINMFMNKFKRLGFVRYSGGGIQIDNSSLRTYGLK
jgi:CRP/FNR family cyclic AMP-dependent transcriptional regulator